MYLLDFKGNLKIDISHFESNIYYIEIETNIGK